MSDLQTPSAELLPRGTVTFVFTDVEGSTRLHEQNPEAMRVAMARHDALVEQSVQANDGRLVRPRGEGDSRFAVFPSATDAVAAARDIQLALAAETWPTPIPIRARIALHTGEADLREGDYYGSEVNRCARLRALAYGGQVLLSQATYVLVRDALPSGVGVRDLGEHRLKDLQRPEHAFQLVLPNLPSDFPPLKSLDAQPNNLPGQLTSFIGREREIVEVRDLLRKARLLTLTGPGGTGKTRLALQVGAEVADQFKDGAWFVDLSALADSALVVQAIARTLGVRDTGERPARELLQDYLREKELLLILDNFEQVIDAAPLVKDLLMNAPRVKFLITSRILLRVAGEQEYEVPQFMLPDLGHLPSLEQLSQYEVVRLFIERARAYKSAWTITNENAPAVAEICYRLDGLPLAIELAAARVRLMPPAQILAQLGGRMTFLKSPARDLPARQQTLRGAIDWSYDLLPAEEKELFRRLAVFVGGATLEGVEVVCAPQPGPSGDPGSVGAGSKGVGDVLTGLESLVDKSLIRQSEAHGEARFTMLETIREYAAARLGEGPEASSAARRSHATYFADLTRSQWDRLTGEGREAALAVLASDIENIRAAWRYWVAEQNLGELGKFTDTLWLLNDARGWYQATVDLTTDLLAVLSPTVSTPERVREEVTLQTSLARALMLTKGYYSQEAEQAYNRALELCEQEGSSPQLFPILRGLATFYTFRAEFRKAYQMGERILALADHLDDANMRVEGHLILGANLANPRQGLAHLEQALAAYDPNRYRSGRFRLGTNPGVVCLTTSALLLWMLGLPDRGRKRAGEAIALASKLDHPYSMAYGLFHYGLFFLWLGEPEVAKARAEDLLAIAGEYEFQVWSTVSACLRGAALAAMGSADEGLTLIRQGLNIYQALKTPLVFLPLLLFLEAGACGLAKKPGDGLVSLDQALLKLGERGSRDAEFAEFCRLKGKLLLAASHDKQAEAEAWFRRALDTAAEIQTSMLELRAAMSLARLWREQGKAEQGRQLLSSAYGKLTEGFTTADLKEAKALLEDLA
jgi:predicted ATPase/class 3 adenylate cyclase